MNSSGRVYFKGNSTNVDVRKLQEKWPESAMKPGDIIRYEELAEVLSLELGTNRFKTIINRWRNLIEASTGKRLAAIDGRLQVLTEPEKLFAVEGKSRSIVRQSRKNLLRTTYVDRKALSDDEKMRLDHVTMNESRVVAIRQLREGVSLPEM